MKKSKKAAQELASKLVGQLPSHDTHINRLTIAQKLVLESYISLKWIIEANAPHLPPEQYQKAIQDVSLYRERFLNLCEAEIQVGEDTKESILLWTELIDLIPEKLWE